MPIDEGVMAITRQSITQDEGIQIILQTVQSFFHRVRAQNPHARWMLVFNEDNRATTLSRFVDRK
jgi:hypothetical protein